MKKVYGDGLEVVSDGHPGVSDPIDEQKFLVNTINRLQQLLTGLIEFVQQFGR